MSDIALSVEGISKRYRIGLKEERPDSLVAALGGALRRPLVNLARLRGLSSFDGTGDGSEDVIWALKDVSFEVKRGEVVGLIGRNGAGKSTLLKILSRITEPTSGRALIHGRVASLLEVGTGFHGELSGRENVYLNGSILGMRKAEIDKKFDEIVDFSGVEKFIDTPVKRYSSGMSVRLAFAVAAHLDPEILLVDEVLAVGDVEFQKKCLGKMQDVTQVEGRAVLFVSHNMPAIARLCGRALLLREGTLVEEGPADKVVSSYLTTELQLRAEQRWNEPSESPGNEWVKVRSIRVVNVEGRSVEAVDVREPAGIEICIDVLDKRLPFVPSISLHDDQGVYVMNALDTSSDWRKPREPGRYTCTAWIPGNLLAEGTLSVTLVLISFAPRRSEKHALVPNAVSFRVFDPIEGDSARGDYVGPWGGAVRPLLQWTTERSDQRATVLDGQHRDGYKDDGAGGKD